MNNDLKQRLSALEGRIKSAEDSPLWITGAGATVRVDLNLKRGEPLTFPTAYEAVSWIEDQVNSHPAGGVISFGVDDITAAIDDTGTLKPFLSAAFGNVPASLGLCTIEPGTTADVRLWLLAAMLRERCGLAFRRRWPTIAETDGDFLADCLKLFTWKNPDLTADDFAAFFYQVTELQPIHAEDY